MNITGKTIGSCVINEYLILFTTDDSYDRIYKIKPPNDSGVSDVVKLAELNLNFNESNKIQTLPFYENESVQKVYWIDGLNQPRVINIAIDDGRIYEYTDTSFNFIQDLKLLESVSVEKLYTTGYFKSGVIQYAATYFNKNGAESNIFWISGMNYISFDDRAGKIDEIVSNSFKINLSNLESKFDYVRIYSIYRTSLDTTPEVKSVIDLEIPSSKSLLFIDNGTIGSIISTDFLLYVGGEELIPQCMSQKNNTLFLGNIQTIGNKSTPKSLEAIVAGSNLNFEWKADDEIVFESSSESGDYLYPYRPKSLNLNNKIKHFKFDETYRLGIQGQYSNGKWSSPIWIGVDKKVDMRYKIRWDKASSVYVKKIKGVYTIDDNVYNSLVNDFGLDFINVRPVIVPLQYSDRTVIAQGIVNNTLSTVRNRNNVSSSKFSYPDYLFRTNGKAKNYGNFNGQYAHFELLKLNNIHGWNDNGDNPDYPSYYVENMANCSKNNQSDFSSLYDTFDKDEDFFFVDRNMVNFISPEIIYNYSNISSALKLSTKSSLYGFSFLTGASSLFKMDGGDMDLLLNYYDIDRITANYYSGTTDFDIRKRVYTKIDNIDLDKDPYSLFPIWSPESYKLAHLTSFDGNFSVDHAPETDISFTNINKSGYMYMGMNLNLLDNIRFDISINNPSILLDDSTVFYKSNTSDNDVNNGLILYSKNVEKIYPANSYFTVRNTYSNTNFRYNNFTGWHSDDVADLVNSSLQIKYNTAPHALFSFKELNGKFACMPRIANIKSFLGDKYFETDKYPLPGSVDIEYDDFNNVWYRTVGSNGFTTPILNRDTYLGQHVMPITDERSKNAVPIFDLYSDVVNDPSSNLYTKYGGNSDDALFNNNWIPCGNPVKFQSGAVVEFTDGDTYIQRFDLLRVFPNDINQVCQHTEIISFICESFINLDGRSDINRYNTNSSLMTPSNYGLVNNIYSQKNNYFNYNILDPLLFNTTRFNNSIIWSKTKVAGAINDAWTNLNMLSSIDLDGVYGEVSSINLFNNDLYAFQPGGVARLLFNERVQQQASDGVSVELTNGYKVPEYRYLTNQYGGSNKWSIIEGAAGVYFIDYKNKSLNLLSDGIKDLSASAGFKSWFNNNLDNRNYTLSYDKINNDLYIHDETECLNYSETLGSFVSFFDYVNVPQMKNVWDAFVSISYSGTQGDVQQLMSEDGLNLLGGELPSQIVSENSDLNRALIWIHNNGDYNMFYGNQKPFSVEYLLNPEPLNDKVFNTFEYRLNDQFIDWNNLEVSNWYQYGCLNDRQYANSLKRKFNVNRVQLPRQSKSLNNSTGLIDSDTRNSLNRIRSTWAKLKLSHNITETNINKKFNMQDLTVTYTI